ncbi:S1C family serine protease [Halobacillus karajensis]|uniref:Serine protease HtrA n=1 Tax=Halobacillus karajensis TaxID=195088 RepID=A0A024P8U2_9BACI|nr:serine protease [Halobacillus karajensis]CDQ21174.1 Putative serine protease HtrA [Halobacillus karajensis]CDQ24762.1 Putative serine protease HtrA [Halobacillus karajensis]CDQ28878.1 Putative serine protease HtrA [Halobacillus karajensis]
MNEQDRENKDVIDEDLYEEIDEEELYELVQEEKRKAYEQERIDKEEQKVKRPFPKWIFWLIAMMMILNIVAVLPNTFSIPAIDFLITSAKLSTDEKVKTYKESVVVVEAGESKGTGFAFTSEGHILTNHHVIEGEKRISVGFPEDGLFGAEVTASYPEVDLAVLDVGGDELPYIELAERTTFEDGEHVYFIGNPLKFTGIANQGNVIGYKALSDWNREVLMLDAPIYRGNSGSPVINNEGKVIGVVFATLHDNVEGRVGLAVPIDYYHERAEEGNQH